MKSLADRHFLILGLGQQSLAMARWCTRHGAQVSVWDSREEPPLAATLHQHCPQARLFSGDIGPEVLQGVHGVLKGPGLAPHDLRIAAVLQAARDTGLRTGGELDLFVLALQDLQADTGYAPKLLAITGTNGKTTTTALTALLVERAGRRVVAAGNIGPTLLDTLAERLDARAAAQAAQAAAAADAADAAGEPDAGPNSPAAAPDAEVTSALAQDANAGPESTDKPPAAEPDDAAALPEVWVLELSSFQLADLAPQTAFEPAAATVLNVTQDHLDWHGDMAAYGAAKARIFGSQATMVINRDDPLVVAMEPQLPRPGTKLPKGTPKPVPREVLRFGLDAPQRPGDFGLVTENGMAWLVRALPADETIKRKRGDDSEEEIHLQRLMPADALRLRGRHNASNALAALALATAIGCPLAPMLHGLREYRGEPHRVEFVGRIGEVEAFDDTKGTNVGATVAAITGLGAERAPARLVVILGGDGKGQDFTPLAAPAAAHVRAVALIGRDAPAIESALAGCGLVMQHHATLEAATQWCFDQARPGDAVLLSPACASFDMFRNYVHRGEVFVQTVQALAAEHGEMGA